jgi:hypothetical protein
MFSVRQLRQRYRALQQCPTVNLDVSVNFEYSNTALGPHPQLTYAASRIISTRFAESSRAELCKTAILLFRSSLSCSNLLNTEYMTACEQSEGTNHKHLAAHDVYESGSTVNTDYHRIYVND